MFFRVSERRISVQVVAAKLQEKNERQTLPFSWHLC